MLYPLSYGRSARAGWKPRRGLTEDSRPWDWVRIRIGNKVFAQQVMPTRGYLSQSELPVTIGLGSAPRIDDVQIVWADGARQTGVALKLNSLNIITQP